MAFDLVDIESAGGSNAEIFGWALKIKSVSTRQSGPAVSLIALTVVFNIISFVAL